MNKGLIWFEIRTTNFIKSIEFYEAVLNTELEIKHLFQQRVALFNRNETGINGCIIEHEEAGKGNGTVLFFKVTDINTCLAQVKLRGGTVISLPSLVKQRDQNGKEIIGKNRFDDEVGYLSEIRDVDGNIVFLYANS